MRTEFTSPFVVHAAGSVGQEIRDANGQIIVWTTDAWAAKVTCMLLNENEQLFQNKERAAEVLSERVGGATIDIGTDEWNCDGRLLTKMRHDILLDIVDMYCSWEVEDGSYEWEWEDEKKTYGGLVLKEQHVVRTVGDLFDELTGDMIYRERRDLEWYEDQFEESLIDYLCDQWEGDLFEDDNLDPLMVAGDRVRAWVYDMDLRDLCAMMSHKHEEDKNGE